MNSSWPQKLFYRKEIVLWNTVTPLASACSTSFTGMGGFQASETSHVTHIFDVHKQKGHAAFHHKRNWQPEKR